MIEKRKKLISYLLIIVISMCCYIEDIYAQNSKRIDLNTKTKVYSLENNQELTIIINNISKYDVITLEGQSTSSKSIEVKAWELSYDRSSNANVSSVAASEVEEINSFAEQSISFDSKGLVINSPSEVNKRKAIHILAPTAIRAKLYINNDLVYSGTISSSSPSMFQGNKAISSNKGYSPKSTILEALSRKPSDEEKSLRQIDALTLRKLATKVVQPTKFTDKAERWAIVQVVVNEDGKVGSTFYSGGDERLASLASDALKQFNFKPFLVDDKPTTIGSLVGVSSSNGEIKLFSEIVTLNGEKRLKRLKP
jgi:hypothetical protein